MLYFLTTKQIYNLKKSMEETLKILVDRSKKGLLTTPNIQVTNMILSDEVLNFPDDTTSMDVSFFSNGNVWLKKVS